MDKQQHSNDLLNRLKQLFSRFFMLDLDKRLQSYRQGVNPQRCKHICKSLNARIDALATTSSQQKGISARQMTDDPHPHEVPLQHRDVAAQTMTASENRVGKDYFENHTVHRDEESSMGDQLKGSAWTHLHSALLYARQGDVSRAKLHADIASQALKEAAHYLSEEDYEELSVKFEQALDELHPH